MYVVLTLVLRTDFLPRQGPQLFPRAINLTLAAQYWFIEGTFASVIQIVKISNEEK